MTTGLVRDGLGYGMHTLHRAQIEEVVMELLMNFDGHAVPSSSVTGGQ